MVDLGLEVAFYTLHVRSNCSLQVHLGRAVATNGRCLPDMCHLLRRLLSFERQIACEQLPIAPGPNAAVSVTVPQRVVRSVCRANTKSATHARTLEPWNLGTLESPWEKKENLQVPATLSRCRVCFSSPMVCKRAWK
jgi:hypothetical protein